MEKKRWKTIIGINYIKELQEIFINGGIINKSPFGKNNGYHDLKKINLPDNKIIKKVIFNDVDLSEVNIKNVRLEGCQFNNCIFTKTNFTTISDYGNQFIKCTFKDAVFKNSVIGYNGSKFIKCSFFKTVFRKTEFIRTEYENCLFKNCNLTSVDFNASSFENCDFEGQLNETWFRGGYKFEQDNTRFGKPKPNKMKNVSFKNASLSFVNFSNNCDLKSVIIPHSGKYIVLTNWSNFLNNLSKEPNDLTEKDKKELNIFINVYSVYAKTQDDYLLNYSDLSVEYGETIANYIWTMTASKGCIALQRS